MTQIFTQYSFRCCDENMTYNVFMHDIKSLSLFSVLSKMNDLIGFTVVFKYIYIFSVNTFLGSNSGPKVSTGIIDRLLHVERYF